MSDRGNVRGEEGQAEFAWGRREESRKVEGVERSSEREQGNFLPTHHTVIVLNFIVPYVWLCIVRRGLVDVEQSGAVPDALDERPERLLHEFILESLVRVITIVKHLVSRTNIDERTLEAVSQRLTLVSEACDIFFWELRIIHEHDD